MKKNTIDMEKVKHVHAGRDAAENGLPRIPPTTDPEAAQLWLAGYDIAKRFAEEEVQRHSTSAVKKSQKGNGTMNRTRTTTEYAVFGKMQDGLWYKVNSEEIGSYEAAKKEVDELKESSLGEAFTKYKVMKRTITITIEDWSEA